MKTFALDIANRVRMKKRFFFSEWHSNPYLRWRLQNHHLLRNSARLGMLSIPSFPASSCFIVRVYVLLKPKGSSQIRPYLSSNSSLTFSYTLILDRRKRRWFNITVGKERLG